MNLKQQFLFVLSISLLFGIHSSYVQNIDNQKMSAFSATKRIGLLRIAVSQRGEASVSRKMLEEFTEKFKSVHPDVPITDRSVQDIPHIDELAIEAGRTHPSQHTPELAEAYKIASELTYELLNAEHVVIASPMYNWGPPSSLKAWIDRVINAESFYGDPKLLKHTPVSFIVTSGGPYSYLEAIKDQDFFRPLLKRWFNSMGAPDENLVYINTDPTGRDENVALERGRTFLDKAVTDDRLKSKMAKGA